MNLSRTLLAVFFLLFVVAACADEADPAADAETEEIPLSSGATAEPQMMGEIQVVNVTVGADGFEPERIALEAGVPARLIFHRTSDSDCASQVTIPAFGIDRTDLPLDEDFPIDFTPQETGEFTFACGMGMMEGTLVVRS